MIGTVKIINTLCTRYKEDNEIEKIDVLPTREQCGNYKRKYVFDTFLNVASVNKEMLPFMVNDREISKKLQIWIGQYISGDIFTVLKKGKTQGTILTLY